MTEQPPYFKAKCGACGEAIGNHTDDQAVACLASQPVAAPDMGLPASVAAAPGAQSAWAGLSLDEIKALIRRNTRYEAESDLVDLCQDVEQSVRAALQQRQAPAPTCICGEPNTLGTVHRTDGPCYVAEAAAPVAIPEGFALVPLKYTPEMRAAWDRAPQSEDDDRDFAGAYAAMIAASPAAHPVSTGAGEAEASDHPASIRALDGILSPQGWDKYRADADVAFNAESIRLIFDAGRAAPSAEGGAAEAKDAARLNFMVKEECYFDTMLADNTVPFYRLYWPHLGEAQSEWFTDPRAAIDAAIEAATPATQQEESK
jgi:hypothetical protein